jgi:GNAT superfamily N-acetyltransferase
VKRVLPNGFEVDDDRTRVDVVAVHAFLSSHSYWARGRSLSTVERLIREATRVVGIYDGATQVAFSRTVSDGVSFAWLADVFVMPEYRGRGLGVELVRETVVNAPMKPRRWILGTMDAHGLYAKFGFGAPSERMMTYEVPDASEPVSGVTPGAGDSRP